MGDRSQTGMASLPDAESIVRSRDPQEQMAAFKALLSAAENGNATAFYRIGLCAAKGVAGLAVNEVYAAEMWHQAVELGSREAYFALGCCYECGRGVDKDLDRALHLWEQAGQWGDQSASFMHLHLSGHPDACKNPGFVRFLKKNQGDLQRVKSPSKSIQSCLKLYSGVVRRKCLYG